MRLGRVIPVLCLLLAGSFSSDAQFGGQRYTFSYADAKAGGFYKMFQRYTVGVSLRSASADFSVHYKENISGAPSLYKSLDTSMEKTVSTIPDKSAGLFLEGFSPIAQLDEQSILAISYGGYVDFFQFKIGDANVIPGDGAVTKDVTGNIGAVLIGLDYRIGGDAFLDKSRRGMFNIGAGISPSFMSVTYEPLHDQDPGTKFKMIPYIKAEAGFFLGIAFKVRGEMMFGKPVYLNTTSEANDTRLDVRMKGGMYGFRLSLALMPYSWDWGSEY